MLRVLVSLTERDARAVDAASAVGREPLSAFRDAVTAVRLRVERYGHPTLDEVDALASSWAKRLGVPSRPACYLVARKCG